MKNLSSGLEAILKKSTDSISKETGVSIGFHDPDTWVSTGSYALNYRLSGDFAGGIPLGKVTMFAGESGSGKSYIVSGNIIREAQKQGIFVVLYDSENALDDGWLTALGVDTSPTAMIKYNVGMIGTLAKSVNAFIEGYRETHGKSKPEDRPKVLIVVDSIGMLNTEIAMSQMADGTLKGDMGHKPKQLKAFITNCVNSLGSLNIGMVVVNHSYESQDMFNPDPKISGGSGLVYASSMVVAMAKRKLKEDESGTKTSSVNGIVAKCKVMKTRYNKPFEDADLKIPYTTGMNPYSGLLDMFEKYELITKSGNRLLYVDPVTGEQILKYRKEWDRNEDACLDHVMMQFKSHPIIVELNRSQSFDDSMYDGSDDEEDGTEE